MRDGSHVSVVVVVPEAVLRYMHAGVASNSCGLRNASDDVAGVELGGEREPKQPHECDTPRYPKLWEAPSSKPEPAAVSR